MSRRTTRDVAAGVVLAAALAIALSACTYDYLQHSDRVAYSAGDAVRANLERETTNPTHRSMYSVKGLGKDGAVATPQTAPSLSSTP